MRTHGTRLLLTLALLGPVAAAAEPAPPPEAAAPGPESEGPWTGHGHRHLQERLEELHKALKLSEAQESGWNAFVAKIKEQQAAKKAARPDFGALKQLPAPDRLQRLIEFGKARQAALEEILSATRTFYDTLSPEQRQTFDDLTPFGARAPKRPKHGGRPHP